MGMELIVLLIIVMVFFISVSAILKRFKRCPSDRILVVYGKLVKNKNICYFYGG